MKKHVIAAAIATAVAAPAAMAGAPTIYGYFNGSVDFQTVKNAGGVKDKTESGTFVSSNRSRIGVKGSADLGNGMKAIYKVETTVNLDSTSTGGWGSGRNAYVGVAGGFGTVLIGRHDTPSKMIQPTDTFNNALGDNKETGGLLGYNQAAAELRLGNVLAYVSPSFSGVKLIAAFVPGEGASSTSESSLSDIYSVAVVYGSKKKGLYLGASLDSLDKKVVGGNSATQMRVVAQYTAGALMGNVMYQAFDQSGGDANSATFRDGTNIMANVSYEMGKISLRGKFSAIDYADSALDDSTAYGVGVDYALGKKTTAGIEYVALDGYNWANKVIDKDAEQSYISVGLVHKF